MSIQNLPQMPQIPQLQDFTALDNKGSLSNFNSFTPANTTTPSSINFGTTGFSGTKMDDLMDSPASNASQQTGGNDMMQMFAQMMQMMMQLLMMMMGQQKGSEGKGNGGPGGGNGGPVDFSNAGSNGQPPSYESATEDGLPAYSENDPLGNPPAYGQTPGNGNQSTIPTGNGQPPAPGTGNESTIPTNGNKPATPTNGAGESTSTTPTGNLHLPPGKESLQPLFASAGKASGIDPAILAGMAYQENRMGMGPSTVNGGNGASDVGMMQVNENTFNELKQKYPQHLGADASLSNLEDNVMAGALYMKDQKEAFGGDMKLALRAYNSGPLNVNPNDHTDISKYGTGDSTYVDKVMNFAEIIRSGNGQLPA